MPGFIGSGGSYKEILSGTAVGAGGAWKKVEAMWVGSGGVWKKWFESIVIALSSKSVISLVFVSGSPSTSTAEFTLYSDGRHSTTVSNASESFIPDEWGREIASGLGADYQARLDVLSGSGPTSGPSTAAWHDINVNRNWKLTLPSTLNGTVEGEWRVRIRNKATTAVMADAEFSMSASVSDIGSS